MTRPLAYLAIFTLFAWSTLISLAFLFPPKTNDGRPETDIIAIQVAIAFIAIALLLGLLISVAKTFLPDRKLPHLLIRDSLIIATIASLGCTGLIVLQLLEVATLLNAGLWLAIIGTVYWVIHSIRHPKSDQPAPTTGSASKRRTVLRKALNKK